MTTYFVSRHRGATAWAAHIGIVIDVQLAHLDPEIIKAGDRVIGTLPVHIAAELCAKGGHYLHLTLNVPEALRGRELSPQEMIECDARIERYDIRKRESINPVITGKS